MLKTLTASLSVLALLFSGCKKQNELLPEKQNQKSITTPEVLPTAVVSPTLFFINCPKNLYEQNFSSTCLYQVDNLLSEKPIITNKSLLSYSYDMRNFVRDQNGWAYNTNTNEIMSIDGTRRMRKLSTTNYNLDVQKISSYQLQTGNLRISPDNTKFYHVADDHWQAIMSGNVQGNLDYKVVFKDDKMSISAMDIDFANKKIYFIDEYSRGIFKMNLDGTNKVKIASVPLSRDIRAGLYPVIRVDPIQNKLYFSAHSLYGYEVNPKFRLYSLTTSGTNLKQIFEATDDDCWVFSKFSFDIYSNKIFYSLKLRYGFTTVGRLNTDGTGKIILFSSYNTAVDDVIVAMPPKVLQ